MNLMVERKSRRSNFYELARDSFNAIPKLVSFDNKQNKITQGPSVDEFQKISSLCQN